MKWILALLVLAANLSAQMVVPMSSEDAARVKAAQQQIDTANQQWDALKKEVGRKYLVVEKDSPDAGNQYWYESNESIFSGTSTVTAGGLATFNATGTVEDYNVENYNCMTAAQRAKLLAEQEKEYKRVMAEREARSKRVHKGFENEYNYVFSDDFKYLLPKPRQVFSSSPTWVTLPGTNLQLNTPTWSGDPGMVIHPSNLGGWTTSQ